MVNHDFLDIIDFDDDKVVCEYPYKKLIIDRYGDHGLSIRCIEYEDELKDIPFDSSLFLFNDWNTELLLDWIHKVLDK